MRVNIFFVINCTRHSHYTQSYFCDHNGKWFFFIKTFVQSCCSENRNSAHCCSSQARNNLHRHRRRHSHLSRPITPSQRVANPCRKTNRPLDNCKRLDILRDRPAITGFGGFTSFRPRCRRGAQATVAGFLGVGEGEGVDDGREGRADKTGARGRDSDGGLFEALVAEDCIEGRLSCCWIGKGGEDGQGCDERCDECF